jgi:Na+/proline symporter
MDDELQKLLGASDKAKAAFAEMSSRAQEALEPFLNGCKSLLIANGAAALVSTQLLNDAKEPLQQNVAFCAGLFCFGFLAAAIGSFFGAYAQQHTRARFWERKGSNREFASYLYLMGIPLVISFCILVLTVAWIGITLLQWHLSSV